MDKDFVYKDTVLVDGYPSEAAKSGKGGGVAESIVGATSDIGAGGTESAKKGTGAVNDFKKISRMAADNSLYYTSSK